MRQRPRRSAGERLKRTLTYRLLIPLFRTPHAPEYTARGVLVGLLVAFTPTVGFQMIVISAIWLAVRSLKPGWDFSLIVAMAWAWTTNVVTMLPVYYVFTLTGWVLLGRWDHLLAYDHFVGGIAGPLGADAGWMQSLWTQAIALFETYGVPMFLGSLPWAVVTSWLGYRWSLNLIRAYRARNTRRGRR